MAFCGEDVVVLVDKVVFVKEKIKVFASFAQKETVHAILQSVSLYVSDRRISTLHPFLISINQMSKQKEQQRTARWCISNT